MRAMQCELCGGTDIVKEDDFFGGFGSLCDKGLA